MTTLTDRARNISEKIIVVNDEIYGYTKLAIAPPTRLIRKRAGLRSALTRVYRQIELVDPCAPH